MRNIKETEHAIKLLDAFVNRMDEAIKVAQRHKQEALEKRDALSKSKASDVSDMATGTLQKKGYLQPGMGPGQEWGWCVEHPFQCAGKTYDDYNRALDDENKAWEEALRQQKKVIEQQREGSE
jgi:hypothetical protein